MKATFLRSAVIALALSLLGTLGTEALFGRALVSEPSFDWDKMRSMPYSEAMAYQVEHTRQVSGLHYVALVVSDRQNLGFALQWVGCYFVLVLCGCLWLGLWQKSASRRATGGDGRAANQ